VKANVFLGSFDETQRATLMLAPSIHKARSVDTDRCALNSEADSRCMMSAFQRDEKENYGFSTPLR
jgi:hypothetical protein